VIDKRNHRGRAFHDTLLGHWGVLRRCDLVEIVAYPGSGGAGFGDVPQDTRCCGRVAHARVQRKHNSRRSHYAQDLQLVFIDGKVQQPGKCKTSRHCNGLM